MNSKQFGLLLLSSLTVASCGKAPHEATQAGAAPTVAGQLAQLAERPELQDPEIQLLLKENANNPEMLDALQRAYGMKPDTAQALDTVSGEGIRAQDTRLDYVHRVAWGSAEHYSIQKGRPKYSGLNWGSDGCSAPSGLGLGYRNTFRAACDVHDFGYGNLPKMTAKSSWDGERKNTDVALHNNMDHICSGQSWYAKPACYAASQAYYTAVRAAGGSHWH